jgi:predicted HTH transcriptional regulator
LPLHKQPVAAILPHWQVVLQAQIAAVDRQIDSLVYELYGRMEKTDMEIPAWADARLSNELSRLREQGEGQELEYKREFPADARDLARDVAAFATCGVGRLLLGVADNGDLIGLAAEDGSARDKHMQRARGIIRTIEPAVKAQYLFAVEEEKTILCVLVSNQDEPVYYYEGRPYIRDGSISRPASPEEAKEYVWKHPSSAHKRFLEQVNARQIEGFVEDSRLHAARMDEQCRSAIQNNNEITKALNRRFLGG